MEALTPEPADAIERAKRRAMSSIQKKAAW